MAKSTPPPARSRDADRSQLAILAAAREEFSRYGLAGARVDRIADAAGLNKRLIYYYFTSKDDMLPKRLLTEPAQTGPAKGLVNKLPEMLPKYYALRGWTPDGQLTPETRARLGL